MADEGSQQRPEQSEDDQVRRLERIADEIKIRDDDESARQKTADSKLTSALAVLPIIIALSTSAFIQLLPYAARIGCLGVILMLLFFAAIVLFVVAAIKAIIGLWPMRAKYAAIGMRTLSAFADAGTYPELLRKIIAERKDVVRNNSAVNSAKLGDYANAALLTVIGLILITFIVLAFVLAFATAPERLLKDNSPTPVPSPSSTSPPPKHASGSSRSQMSAAARSSPTRPGAVSPDRLTLK
jgi:hypothetical protein